MMFDWDKCPTCYEIDCVCDTSKLRWNRVEGGDLNDYRSPERFVHYAQRYLGTENPTAQARGHLHMKIRKEMSEHLWSWEDMANTVRYVKLKKIPVETVYNLLPYVDEAKVWAEGASEFDLQGKVADALASEIDETWRRRLALAQGKALGRVYEMWLSERANAF